MESFEKSIACFHIAEQGLQTSYNIVTANKYGNLVSFVPSPIRVSVVLLL
jgi:hypothetical protein